MSFFATGMHAPSRPGSSHASHWPVHLLSQHTPSTQNPVEQSPGVAHGFPASGGCTHFPS